MFLRILKSWLLPSLHQINGIVLASLDINSIENLCSLIKKKKYMIKNQYSSRENLWVAIKIAINHDETIQKLLKSVDESI